jgi:hypothetical protein
MIGGPKTGPGMPKKEPHEGLGNGPIGGPGSLEKILHGGPRGAWEGAWKDKGKGTPIQKRNDFRKKRLLVIASHNILSEIFTSMAFLTKKRICSILFVSGKRYFFYLDCTPGIPTLACTGNLAA